MLEGLRARGIIFLLDRRFCWRQHHFRLGSPFSVRLKHGPQPHSCARSSPCCAPLCSVSRFPLHTTNSPRGTVNYWLDVPRRGTRTCFLITSGHAGRLRDTTTLRPFKTLHHLPAAFATARQTPPPLHPPHTLPPAVALPPVPVCAAGFTATGYPTPTPAPLQHPPTPGHGKHGQRSARRSPYKTPYRGLAFGDTCPHPHPHGLVN